MVLRLSGAGLVRRCCQCRTGGRLLLDLNFVFIQSVLDGGGGGVVGTTVLEQPVQDLMSLRQTAVGGRALRGRRGVMRC